MSKIIHASVIASPNVIFLFLHNNNLATNLINLLMFVVLLTMLLNKSEDNSVSVTLEVDIDIRGSCCELWSVGRSFVSLASNLFHIVLVDAAPGVRDGLF